MDRIVTYLPSVRRFATTALGAALFSLALVGCGGTETPPPPGPCTLAQVTELFGANKYGCNITGCHDAVATGGNFSMGPGFEANLVGVAPKGGGANASKCGGMNKVYLTPGSDPATGLFIDKLTPTPGCGDPMPMVGNKMKAADLACVKSWATTLTKGASGGAGDAGTGG